MLHPHHRHEESWLERTIIELEILRHLSRPPVMIFLAVVVLFSSSLWQQPEEQLTGEVRDRDNNLPVAGATITLNNTAGKVLHTAQTDELGVFAFPVLEHTGYTLKLEKQGYQSRVINDTPAMNNNRSVLLRIAMHQAPPN